MLKPTLIIVTGAPGTGKTTLAKKIADHLSLPLICKDEIKELLFDELKWLDGDIEWSKKLGLTSIKLLFQVSESLLKAGVSHVIENNFHPEFGTQDFLALKGKINFHPFQILVTCDLEVLVKRVQGRHQSGSRHPGHPDLKDKDLTQQLGANYTDKLKIGGEFYQIDTTDFEQVNYDDLFRELSRALANS